jgi:serine/threonine-protein kinase
MGLAMTKPSTPCSEYPSWLREAVAGLGTVGGCRIESCIKDGERGALYRGWCPGISPPVVVKVPSHEHVWGRITTAMLEALFLSYVRHPAVVRIHAAGQDREIDYLVLEFIQGENLDQFMVREGRLSPLAAVHLRGVIHCDVKPGNIMRTDRGRVKLVDFGLARFLGSGAWPFGEGVITASPHYMSLEQAEGRPLDCRTDIYSLGATFYHVLAGEPPYGDAEMDTLSHYLAAPPVPLRAVAPGIPSALARILDRMMERRPENRPASMIDVRDAVGAWLKDQEQSAA